jgi:ABC-2 type transport system permease protein
VNLRRTWSVMRKETRHIVRDRTTFVLVTISPVLLLVILAYSLSVDIRHVGIGVMDKDLSPVSRAYVDDLTTGGDLIITARPASYAEVENLLMHGGARGVVIIPPGFADDLRGGRTASLQALVDGTDPNTAGYVITQVSARTEAFVSGVTAQVMARQGYQWEAAPPIDLSLRTWYNPAIRFTVGFVPALLAVALSMPAISAALTIAREREMGTLEGLIATPIRRSELLVGKIIPYVFTGLLSTLLCALVAVYWFRIPFRGSFPLFLVLSTDYLFATLSISLVLSALVGSQQVAMIAAFLIFLFPGFFLSGIFIPLASMGPLMKMEAYMMPSTHYVIINRGLFVKGLGLGSLWGSAVVLLVTGCLFTVLAVAIFRKTMS